MGVGVFIIFYVDDLTEILGPPLGGVLSILFDDFNWSLGLPVTAAILTFRDFL